MNPFIRIIPPFLVRTFARRYVAGDSLERAMAACRSLQAEGKAATLDLLAENIESPEVVEANVDLYLRMVDAVAEANWGQPRMQPTVSLKLSSYTTSPLETGGNAKGSREAAFRIVEHAAQRGVRLTVDMESHHWTDYTLQLLRELHTAGHRHVGAVLQTRLHRTEKDLANLPEGMRVRLVIGIYEEPAAIALTNKVEMKERLLTYAESALRAGRYVEFATHDESLIQRFVEEVVPRCGATPEHFEVQMLYGVPRHRTQRELQARGITVRLYVPFATGWPMAIAYLRRRLDEYPRMMLLVAKNLVVGR